VAVLSRHQKQRHIIRMVHPSYKQGHVTTGSLGIPNVNDCNGQLSRKQWDSIVRNDAVAALEEEKARQEERRKRQSEQAAYLQQQINLKLSSRQNERQSAIAEESTSLQREQRSQSEQQNRDRQFLSSYRQYLDRCQLFSEANSATPSNVGYSPRKQPLQAGAGLMPFVEPSEKLRQHIDDIARATKTSDCRKLEEQGRSHSPREMVHERWRTQQQHYEDEVGEIERRNQNRQRHADRLREKAEQRAARAAAVAPSPRQQVELTMSPPREGVATASPRIPTRRELQDALRLSLEGQLAEKRRRQEEDFANARKADIAAMKTLNDTINSTRLMQKKQKEDKQTSYRTSLEDQLHQEHRSGVRQERGFLPEVAVKPFRQSLISPRRV
jgi:hypothetical protein